ncbi:MAG: restriction endonuclease subunit S [Chloroflexota bacterium]|nr:restriction endonuclease subunit S [Chloroflexota bacterium]
MSASVDLSPAHRAIVERILTQHVPESEVWAFGSRATWTAKDYSDLDLAIVNQESLDRTKLSRISEAFEESNLPMRVDVVDWHAISDSFRKVIQRDYVVVQERTDQAAAGEWKEGTLGDVCTKIGSGATPRGGKEAYVEDGPYSLIRSQNVHNSGFSHHGLASITDEQAEALRNVEVLPNDVLLNITGDSVARVCQVDPAVLPARVNQHVAIIRTDPRKFNSRYLRYYLVAPEVQSTLLSWAGSGGTRNALTKQMLESFEVRAPAKVSEQRAIAHILGTLDDKIELNRRMNQTLEEMARALFKSWFVDFDPVRAKATLKQHALGNHIGPNAESNESGVAPAEDWTVERARAFLGAMEPQVASLFPDRLVASELGEIPEGWEVTALREFSDLNPESWTRADSPREVEYVDLANTKWGVIETTCHFLWKDAPSRARRVLRPGDTIVGTVRPGNGSYSLVGRDGLTGSTGFAVLRPSHRNFRELIYLAATAPDNIERLSHRADGAAYPAVRPEVVAETEVSTPASVTKHLGWFSGAVGSILDRIESIATESSLLAAQRDALLPRLVSGQVRTKESQARLSHEMPL